MDTVHREIAGTIGDTPMVALRRLAEGLPAKVAVKLESRNPGGSVKDRMARSMIEDAETRGLITPGRSVIIEPTSGNTGIALAMIGASRGYRVVLTMPESMSVERRKLLAAYGAELILTPAAHGMQGAVEAAEDLAASVEGAYLTRQFDNPANPLAHYQTTGPEIDRALGPDVLGAFVAGVGTGGTITGVARYMAEHRPNARMVVVEPAESPIISQRLEGKELTPAGHGIQGIGANFVPSVLDLGVIDSVQHVTTREAIAMARRLAADEGMLVGISSGANVTAALRIAADPALAGTTIVTVAPSTGERYLTTALWEGLAE